MLKRENYSKTIIAENNMSRFIYLLYILYLAFGSRVVGLELAKMIVDAWLGAQYEGGRHQQRVEAITAIEQRRN